MARLGGLLDQGIFRRIGGASPAAVTGLLKRRARERSAEVERLVAAADTRIAANIPRPLHTDWAWRPEAWAGSLAPGEFDAVSNGASFGGGVKFFLDCRNARISARQIAGYPDAGAARAIAIEIARFQGTFFSLAVDLPDAALTGLSRRHLVRIGCYVEASRPVAVYARLNLRHGPNVAQLVCRFEGEPHVDLDLAASDLDAERLSGGWVDLILEAPLDGRIVLADVTVSRRPRAAL